MDLHILETTRTQLFPRQNHFLSADKKKLHFNCFVIGDLSLLLQGSTPENVPRFAWHTPKNFSQKKDPPKFFDIPRIFLTSPKRNGIPPKFFPKKMTSQRLFYRIRISRGNIRYIWHFYAVVYENVPVSDSKRTVFWKILIFFPHRIKDPKKKNGWINMFMRSFIRYYIFFACGQPKVDLKVSQNCCRWWFLEKMVWEHNNALPPPH